MDFSQIEFLPSWVFFIGSILLLLAAFEIGFGLGLFKQGKSTQENHSAVRIIVTANLILLSFILAFTFSISAYHFEERNALVLEESNSIMTTYLRARYLEEPYRAKLEALLRKYVDMMIDGIRQGTYMQLAKRYDYLQDLMWVQAEAIAQRAPQSAMDSLFIESLNDMIDVHAKRVNKGEQSRIPKVIWVVIFFLSFLAALSVGYQAGIVGFRSYLVNFVLILTFSAIIGLIADLDHPQQGLLRVGRQSMTDLQDRMSSELISN